jgi:hypothetical protein
MITFRDRMARGQTRTGWLDSRHVCVASRKSHGGANLGLRSVVGRSAGKSPYSGRWAVAATAAKVSQQGKACLEGRRFLPGAPLTIRSSPRAPPTP